MYRSRQRACPVCRAAMDEILVTLSDGSTPAIDVCRECRWVFVEFFDGEPVSVARGVRELVTEGPVASAAAPLTCPDCGTTLQQAGYEGAGPLLWRCGDCMGLVADFATLEQLARHHLPPARSAGVLHRLARLLGLAG